MNEKRQASNKTTAERQNKNRAKSKRAERDKKNSYFCWPHRLHFCFLYFFFALLLLLLLLNLHFLSRIFNWYSWCKRGLLLLILGRHNYLILQSMLQLFSSTIVSHSILLVLLCYVLRWLLRRAEDV